MFTTVNSIKKISQHILKEDATSSALDDSNSSEKVLPIAKQLTKFFSVSDDYFSLQLAIFVITLILSTLTSVVTCFFVSTSFGLSLFVGSITGIFYLRLLSKSIGNLGKNSSGVSKFQLLLPVCLFIFASRNDLIQIFPSFIGFFMYKPALFFYFSRP